MSESITADDVESYYQDKLEELAKKVYILAVICACNDERELSRYF